MVLLGVLLVIVSFVSTPRVDAIEASEPSAYPFYYASQLPITFYVAAVYLALSAIFIKRHLHKILLVVLLAVLLEFTPVAMLENPWVPDQYIYSAEPAYLATNHHISSYHYVDSTPGLALTFSSAILSSAASPMILWQVAPFLGVFATCLIILIGRRIGTNGALCGLLFLAFNYLYQTNIFHRQTYSFVLFLVSVMFLLLLIEKRRFEFSIGYLMVLFAIIIAHPGTSAFLLLALAICTAGFYVLYKNRTLVHLTLLSVVGFFAYNLYVSLWDLPRMVRFIQSAMTQVLYGDVGQAPGLEYLTGYTASFDTVMSIRMLIALAYLALASLAAVYIALRKGNMSSRFISLMHFGFLLAFLTFMFGGASFRLRPLLFLIPTSALLIAKFQTVISDHKIETRSSRGFLRKVLDISIHNLRKKPVRMAGIICVIGLLTVAPVLRYSGIPYLQPHSEELTGKLFLDRYWDYDSPIYVTERNLPYGYSLILIWEIPNDEPYTILEYERDLPSSTSFFTVQRYITRDGYWAEDVSFEAYLEGLLNTLPESHNVVYQSDEYHIIFRDRAAG